MRTEENESVESGAPGCDSDASTTRFEFLTWELAREQPAFPLIDELYRQKVLSERSRSRILLALQEAVANSVEHGNLELRSEWRDEYDSEGVDRYQREREKRLQDNRFRNRRVFVTTECVDRHLVITVRDEGPGFTTASSRVHQLPPEVQCHGRGITLIESTMDEVSWHDGGREVVMKKRLE